MRERKTPEAEARRQYLTWKERESNIDVAFVSNSPKPKQFSNSTLAQGNTSWSMQKSYELKKKKLPPK